MAKIFFKQFLCLIQHLSLSLLFCFSFLNATVLQDGLIISLESLKLTDQDSLFIETISFQADLPFSQEEFYYLTGLKKQTFITGAQFKLAHKMLLRKKRFSMVEFMMKKTALGYALHVVLSGNWLFKKLSLVGVFWEKHRYHDLYLMQPGQLFETSVHTESIQRLKSFLHDRGYLEAQIDDCLISDRKSKEITVRLTIRLGKRFKVKEVRFVFSHDSGKSFCKAESFLSSKLASLVKDQFYSKKNNTKIVTKLQRFLRRNGFIQNKIQLKRLLDAATKKIILVFDVHLGKKRFLSFEGNEALSSKFLQEKVIGQDYPEWLLLPDIVAEQITQAYIERGYWDVVVTHSKNSDGYLFKISEGALATILKVEIFDEFGKQLKASSSFFNSMIMPQPFNEQLFTTQFEALKKKYQRFGFWDFTLLDRRTVKERDNVYRLILSVNKGVQRYIGPVVLNSHSPEAKEALAGVEKNSLFNQFIGNKNNKVVPFDIKLLQDQRLFLLNYFQTAGYWYAFPELSLITHTLKNKKGWNWQSVLVTASWNINEDDPVRFGKIIVRSTGKLPFKKILREMRCTQGRPWDKSKVDLSRSRLKNLGIFKQIQLQPYKLSKKEREKSLLVTLLEDDPFEMRFRAGYSLTSKNFLFRRESTFTGGGSFIIKNPLNIADKLMFDADVSKFERNVNLEYQVPQLFNLSMLGRFRFYTNRYVEPLHLWRGCAAYEADRNGVVMVFDNEYKLGYHAALSFGNEWVKTSRVRGALDLNSEMINKTVPYFFVEPSLVIDTLDDKLKVQKGGLTIASLKTMFPHKAGLISHRLLLEQSLFYPLVGSLIGAVRVRFGHIFCKDFDRIMPIERFFLGGPTSVRGYEKNAVPPLGKVLDEGTGEVTEYTIQGGRSMFNLNLEARFPLFGALDGVVFQDFGILSKRWVADVTEKWYPTTGFGLRYNTPIGALRFDIGWKWNLVIPQESSYAWYLTLGHAF